MEETGRRMIKDSIQPFGVVEEKRKSIHEDKIWHQINRYYICEIDDMVVETSYTENEKKYELSQCWIRLDDAIKKNEEMLNREGILPWLEWRVATDEMIAVELKENNKLIGNVYLGKRDFNSLELGYVFNKKYWGKGYAKESIKYLIQKAFSDKVHRIYAECDPNNPNSWRLLEALGFEREAFFKQNVYFWTNENGEPLWKDTYVYALRNNEEYTKIK